MAKQQVNLGTADKGNGDPLRVAFAKVNDNFTELYTAIENGGISLPSQSGNNGKFLTTNGTSVSWATVTPYSFTASTTAPTLSAGALWFNSTEGRLYINYNNTWVDSNPTEIDPNAIRFNNLNQIELPEGGDIVDSTGASVLGGGGANLGNWAFRNDLMYSLNGGVIENSDTSHGATSGLTIPTNGSDSPIVLTNTYGNVVLVSGVNAGSTVEWTFNNSGTITTPLLLPKTFTAVLDNAHRSVGSAISGTPWQFTVAFVVDQNGAVETQMDNPFPNPSNPGYVSGDGYEFTEADHGIPGFIFNITLNSVVLPGGAGWTANPSVSQAPDYPSTVSSSGAIKVTSNENSWIFGTDGNLKLPGVLQVNNGIEGSITGLSGVNIYAKNATPLGLVWTLDDQENLFENNPLLNAVNTSVQFGIGGLSIEVNPSGGGGYWTFAPNKTLITPGDIQLGADSYLRFPDSSFQGTAFVGDASRLYGNVDEDVEVTVRHRPSVSANCHIAVGDEFVADTEFNDDITVVQVGWTVDVGGTEYTVTSIDPAPPAWQYRITAAGATFVQGTTYTFTNPTATLQTWTFNQQTGTLIAPGGAILSSESVFVSESIIYRNFSIEIPTQDSTNEYRWTFNNTAGSLTVPGVIKSNGAGELDLNVDSANIIRLSTTDTVGEITDLILHPTLGISLTTNRNIAISAAVGETELYNIYYGLELEFQLFRDMDEEIFTQGTRPWVGLPSYQAYPLILTYNYTGPGIPVAGNLAPAANAAKLAYEAWQAELAAINVTIDVADKDWVFGQDGSITLPNGGELTGGGVWVDAWLTAPLGATKTAGVRDFFGKTVAFAKEDSFVIESSRAGGPKIWTFSETGILTLPSSSYLETTDNNLKVGSQGTVTIRSNAATVEGTNAWVFGTTGRTTFPNGVVPEHSYGAAGDKEGMVVFSDPYIYYCKQDYVDDLTDIWVRVAWTGTNW